MESISTVPWALNPTWCSLSTEHNNISTRQHALHSDSGENCNGLSQDLKLTSSGKGKGISRYGMPEWQKYDSCNPDCSVNCLKSPTHAWQRGTWVRNGLIFMRTCVMLGLQFGIHEESWATLGIFFAYRFADFNVVILQKACQKRTRWIISLG